MKYLIVWNIFLTIFLIMTVYGMMNNAEMIGKCLKHILKISKWQLRKEKED
jgi:uncharacterized membrane protein YciS (DUF1049 family)